MLQQPTCHFETAAVPLTDGHAQQRWVDLTYDLQLRGLLQISLLNRKTTALSKLSSSMGLPLMISHFLSM